MENKYVKVKIRATGEILRVADYAVIAMENCDSYGNPLEYAPEDVELIPDTPTTDGIDWEQRRFDLVKAAMQGYITAEGREYMHKETSMKNTAELCVKFADAVVAEYKKGGEK